MTNSDIGPELDHSSYDHDWEPAEDVSPAEDEVAPEEPSPRQAAPEIDDDEEY